MNCRGTKLISPHFQKQRKEGSGIEEKGEYIHTHNGVPKEQNAKSGVSIIFITG